VIAAGAGLAVAGLVTVAVLAVLRVPLLAVLTELCDGDARARFWWRVLGVAMVAGTALCASLALLVVGVRADGWRWGAAAVQGGAAGLLVSLGVAMLAVVAFARSRGGGVAGR
jgi:hypothetical protein